MGIITIINKKHPTKQAQSTQEELKRFYCGRGSALGNPFKMASESDRDAVCDQYQEYFDNQVKAVPENYPFHNELDLIFIAASEGDIHLQCFCAPKRCHCETIKTFIDDLLSKVNKDLYYRGLNWE